MTSTSKLLRRTMAAYGMSQNALAQTSGASQSYASQVLSGERLPSAQWLNTVATAMGLSPAERAALNRAAAKDHGFEIDLTERGGRR